MFGKTGDRNVSFTQEASLLDPSIQLSRHSSTEPNGKRQARNDRLEFRRGGKQTVTTPSETRSVGGKSRGVEGSTGGYEDIRQLFQTGKRGGDPKTL